MKKSFIFIMILSTILFATNNHLLSNKPVQILASGNNKFVLPELIENFNILHPEAKVIVEYGATGELSNAIMQGVNYDIFLAADMNYPQKVYDAKKALYPPKQYAQGFLILFIPADKTLKQRKLNTLKEGKISNITIANTKTAPYGKATIEVLKNTKLYKTLLPKIRYSKDISTAITNVIWYDDAGFLSKSALTSLPIGYRTEGRNWIEIDPKLYSPILQGYVISPMGAKNINAKHFIDFMFSDIGRQIYSNNGYK